MKQTVKNIWSLDKDPAIKTLLIMLQHEVGPNGFMLLDESLLNIKAVRIIYPPTQRKLSAYVYSYAQREAHYGLDLEFPYLIETRADDQTISLNDLTAEEVLKKVIEHLEIRLPVYGQVSSEI
jgi:hypothetical protein